MNNTQYKELWSSLSKRSRRIETKMDALTRKRTGSYYTDLELTDAMMRELVEHLKDKNPTKKLYDYRFLEPCVGAGNFVFSYIKAVKATGINKENAKIMLDNLYVADVVANQGPTLKRIRPRAQGRAYRINKKTAHISIYLDEKK